MSSRVERSVFILDYGYFRGCAGKAKFNSEKAAQNHRDIRRIPDQLPYKCRYCPNWHLGHPGKEPKR